jgi:hypothetical protein
MSSQRSRGGSVHAGQAEQHTMLQTELTTRPLQPSVDISVENLLISWPGI